MSILGPGFPESRLSSDWLHQVNDSHNRLQLHIGLLDPDHYICWGVSEKQGIRSYTRYYQGSDLNALVTRFNATYQEAIKNGFQPLEETSEQHLQIEEVKTFLKLPEDSSPSSKDGQSSDLLYGDQSRHRRLHRP